MLLKIQLFKKTLEGGSSKAEKQGKSIGKGKGKEKGKGKDRGKNKRKSKEKEIKPCEINLLEKKIMLHMQRNNVI